jgi:RNA polymerase sigma-70 factor (ECF subfamily)
MANGSQKQTWLDLACQGDPSAISKLIVSYHPLLRRRVAERMGDAIMGKLEPEDILQEVYVDVFGRISRFENRGLDAFLNWLLTIVDSKVRDAGRALHRKLRDVDREVAPDAADVSESYWNLLDELYADSGTPSRVVRRDEAVGALLACMSQLSPLHQQVIQMRFLEGRSVREAAEALDKSDANVVALTKAALKALRKSMDRLGEFTHADQPTPKRRT